MTDLTQTQETIAGSFGEVVKIFTTSDLELGLIEISANDMRSEALAALAGKDTEQESEIYYASWVAKDGDSESTQYCYFPNARRGAVCSGGDSEWTDCNSLDDLERRWNDYDNSWSN
jgi:hypothetical protein